jgi:hypothetical protein
MSIPANPVNNPLPQQFEKFHSELNAQKNQLEIHDKDNQIVNAFKCKEVKEITPSSNIFDITTLVFHKMILYPTFVQIANTDILVNIRSVTKRCNLSRDEVRELAAKGLETFVEECAHKKK